LTTSEGAIVESEGASGEIGVAQGARVSGDNGAEEVEEILGDLLALGFSEIRTPCGKQIPIDENDLGAVREILVRMDASERESLRRDLGAAVLSSLDDESLGALARLASIANDLEAGEPVTVAQIEEALEALDALDGKSDPEEVSTVGGSSGPGEREGGRQGKREPARPSSSGSGMNRAQRRRAARQERREARERRGGRGKGLGGAEPSRAAHGSNTARERLFSEAEVDALLDLALGGSYE
jgi:hypothetical protein